MGRNYGSLGTTGADDRAFELKHDGISIYDTAGCSAHLSALASSHLQHPGLDGYYSWEGSAQYDPHTKSFKGKDIYRYPTSKILNCCIPILLPRELWFDYIEVTLRSFDDSEIRVWLEYLIQNGPYSNDHVQSEAALRDKLKLQVESTIDNTRDFYHFWVTLKIDRSDFQDNGITLQYAIKEIAYTAIADLTTPICIQLKNC